MTLVHVLVDRPSVCLNSHEQIDGTLCMRLLFCECVNCFPCSYVALFLTLGRLDGFQEAADDQVDSDDQVVCPLAQGSGQMLQVLLQVTQEERPRVRDRRPYDGRDGLETHRRRSRDMRYQHHYIAVTAGSQSFISLLLGRNLLSLCFFCK